MYRIFKHLFENGLYLGHPIFKIAIGLVLSKFHHLVGDASCQGKMDNYLGVQGAPPLTLHALTLDLRVAMCRTQSQGGRAAASPESIL